jgi:hypothetical protein
MELKEVNRFDKAKCACCGYYTISEIAEICPVCYWEENIYQEQIDQSDSDAPNNISLNQAKKNFLKFGAITADLMNVTRKPYPEELS